MFFSIQDGILLMLHGTFWMCVLSVYLELVMPKTYGKRVHPLFFLGCPWKCRKFHNKLESDVSLTPEDLQNIDFETKYLKKDCYEAAASEI
jgi:hypothetical protein